MQPDDLLRLRYGDARQAGDTLQERPLLRVLARRTYRRYLSRPVETELIDDLLSLAFCASSKSDYQQASVIVVRDAKLRRRIAERHPAMPWIGTAPAFLVFCADANRLDKVCVYRGRLRINDDLESFFNASVDAVLVAQTFILAAEQVGLGCCPISAIRKDLFSISELLGLPERVFPVFALCVGYPADEAYISMRLPLAVTRHVDRYDDSNLISEIEAYDRRREAQAPTSRDRQRDVGKFGYAERYGWSEDKSRHAQADDGNDFGAMIRAKGFTLA